MAWFVKMTLRTCTEHYSIIFNLHYLQKKIIKVKNKIGKKIKISKT